ncbi:unnamed protein product, partial [Closterium sp. NIES-53]
MQRLTCAPTSPAPTTHLLPPSPAPTPRWCSPRLAACRTRPVPAGPPPPPSCPPPPPLPPSCHGRGARRP